MNFTLQNLLCRLFLLILLPFSTFSQTTTVRGLVTDAKTGDPLPFVSVFIEGTTVGKNTDFNGQYFIETKGSGSPVLASVTNPRTVVV